MLSVNRPSPSLVDVLSHESPIRDRLWELLPADATLMLSRTSKALYALYGGLWDINHCLNRFVSDPIALRSLMATHNALISGSFAVQFFSRESWKGSDLDIYLEKGSAVEAFDVHLRKTEGYELEKSSEPKGHQWEARKEPTCTLYALEKVRL